jgi:hypothetical protein
MIYLKHASTRPQAPVAVDQVADPLTHNVPRIRCPIYVAHVRHFTTNIRAGTTQIPR